MTTEEQFGPDCLWLAKILDRGDYWAKRSIKINLMVNLPSHINKSRKIDSIEITKEDLQFLLEE